MAKPVRIKSVELLRGYSVRLGLTNGAEKIVDLGPYLRGPIFEAIRNDPKVFQQIKVDSRAGTVVWPNGADIDPDVLCEGLEPCWTPDESLAQSATSN
jgi:hypothetical protein